MISKTLKYLITLPAEKNKIKNIYKDIRVSDHIEQLYDLIDYQHKVIAEQRSIIIADKHHKAWEQYYQSLDQYNLLERRQYTKEELQKNDLEHC